jgi:hypothetical protein
MAFVPEGQADSSQARSAWVAMERGRVPEGRSKSLSVPQIFVVATEPRHVANDSASNAHAASEMPGLPVEKFGSGNCETLTLKAPSPCCQLKLCSCRRVWRIQADDPLLASDLTKLRSVQSSRWDAAIFLTDSRHFVPGYCRAVPSGTKAIRPSRRLTIILALMRVNPGLCFFGPLGHRKPPKFPICHFLQIFKLQAQE